MAKIAKIQLEDGRVAKFEVPDDFTPEQAQQAADEHFTSMQQQPIEQPQQEQAPQELSVEGPKPATKDHEIRSNFLSRLGFGAMEPMIGAGQMLAHGISAIAPEGSAASGLGDTVDNYWKNEKNLNDEANKITDVGFNAAGVAGNVLSPANALIAGKLPQGAGVVEKILSGIGTGAKVGAIAPSYGNDFSNDKSKQIIENAAFGGAIPAVGAAVKPVAGAIADVIGGVGTHTGGESIKEAAKAGFQGGTKAEDFLSNLRETVPKTNIIDVAKQNIERMGQEKSQAYRQGMAQVSGDRSILDFSDIDTAIKSATEKVRFKNQVKNEKASAVVNAIKEEVTKWKRLKPGQYHTPEGLDALKQKIGAIQESIPYENRSSRLVAGEIYNSIKDQIAKQAPVYNKVMKDYHDATDLTREIENAFSLKSTSTADQAMRKLQTLMRNNANTGYGNRLQLAERLQDGGTDIMAGLAGQALSSPTSRGIGNITMGATGLGGLATGNIGAIPLMAIQSPRLVGESAYYGGKMAKILDEGQKQIPGKKMIAQYLFNKSLEEQK